MPFSVDKVAVEQTPPGHAPANIIKLRLLIKLGLQLRENFTFKTDCQGHFNASFIVIFYL